MSLKTFAILITSYSCHRKQSMNILAADITVIPSLAWEHLQVNKIRWPAGLILLFAEGGDSAVFQVVLHQESADTWCGDHHFSCFHFFNKYILCSFFVLGCVLSSRDINLLSHFRWVQLFATLWTVAHQAPLSMGFSQARIPEWVTVPLLQGIFPTQGSNLCLLAFEILARTSIGKIGMGLEMKRDAEHNQKWNKNGSKAQMIVCCELRNKNDQISALDI